MGEISELHQKLLESNAGLHSEMKEVARRLSSLEAKVDMASERYATKAEVHEIKEDIVSIKNRLWGIIVSFLLTILGGIIGFLKMK